MNYPPGWPKCVSCDLPALDGHLTCGNAACDERHARMAKLLQHFARGDRVRAVMDLYFAHDASEVAEGSLGTVEEAAHLGVAALVRVHWDGLGRAQVTSGDLLEKLPE